MANPKTYADRRRRIVAALPALSDQLQADISSLVDLADRIGGIYATIGGSAPPPPPPRTMKRRGRRKAKKTTRVPRNTLKRRQRSKERFPTEQKDQLRLQLLRADKKGDPTEIRRIERQIRVAYRKAGLTLRTSGLRSHSNGAWKGAFIARLLARATSARTRNALVTELAELYGMSRDEILAASKAPSPRRKGANK